MRPRRVEPINAGGCARKTGEEEGIGKRVGKEEGFLGELKREGRI